MNRAILPFLISAAACLGADPDKATTKELSDLIHSLPVREQLDADAALFKDASPPNEKQREATERLKKAQDGFARLKALLRTGASVFDYPGLIALTLPRHSDFDNIKQCIRDARKDRPDLGCKRTFGHGGYTA